MSLTRPDSRRLKQQLIRGLLLTQAREREGYSSQIELWGKPEAAEAGVTLQ